MSTGIYQIDQPRSGIENMAVDQAMLETTARDGVPRLRFYQWADPTLSLGYFLKFSDWENYRQGLLDGDTSQLRLDEGLPRLVRRATGGGAILHHFDWTYSVAMPNNLLEAKSELGASANLYDSVHNAVVAWLRHLGVEADLWNPNRQMHNVCNKCDFLCFRRRHSGDVVVGEYKIMGSAQRRHPGALLQHGSLLLAQSPYTPELLGVSDIAISPNRLVLNEFCKSIWQSLANRYKVQFQPRNSPDSLTEVDDAIRKRLESPAWIARI